MALEDINFQEGDIQNFINEIPLGDLNSPVDIVTEQNGTLLLLETPQIVPGEGGNIFIMVD